jgi:hypothetical protein
MRIGPKIIEDAGIPPQQSANMDQNLNTDAEPLTKTLCSHLAKVQFGDLSTTARKEARRGVLDWIGCALAGNGHMADRMRSYRRRRKCGLRYIQVQVGPPNWMV